MQLDEKRIAIEEEFQAEARTVAKTTVVVRILMPGKCLDEAAATAT